MHDCKGRPLTVGDTVLVPFTVFQTIGGEDYCNVALQTVATMPPGTSKLGLTLNALQTIRANDGDETAFVVEPNENGVVLIK